MKKSSFPQQWLQAFGKFSLDFFVIEMGSQIKVLNRGGESSSYFGYPSDVFVSQIEGSFEELILTSDRAHVVEIVQEAKDARSDIDLQFHLIRFEKTVSQIHLLGTYLYSTEGLPIYLFLLSDEKQDPVLLDCEPKCFKISFVVDTGSLAEVNLQGRTAFLVHEFTNIYEAITIFATRYVHP